MSTICLKSFTLTVSPYYAYFKLDEPNLALALVDSVNAFNLALSFGSTTSVVGKINTGIALGNLINTEWSNGPNTHWNFSDSFTIRFWIKPETTAGNYILLSSNPGWSVQWFGGSDILEFLVPTNSGSAFVDIGPISPGTWHEVFFWIQNGVGCGASLDNGAPVLSANTDLIRSFASSSLLMTNSHFMTVGFAIDEIAIWKKVLSAAERNTDWNFGNGTTYT